MIGFEDYAKIKNNYCLCYFGQCNEYLVLLELLRPRIEACFPGMNFFIGCKDDCANVLNTKDKVLPLTELKARKHEFAHIKELKYESDKHPIQQILESSDVQNIGLFAGTVEPETTKAIIVTHNTYPTDPMNARHIDVAQSIAEARGFEVEFSDDWEDAGLVIGVESTALVRAGHAGKALILADTGVGTNFYGKLFPQLETLPV